MGRVREQATVHPKTVTKVSKGQVKKRRKPAQRMHRATKVEVKQQHPALRMAHDLGIDPCRIQILEDTGEVGFLWGCIIHNEPGC